MLCNSDTAKSCPWSDDYSECVPLAESLDFGRVGTHWLGQPFLCVSSCQKKCQKLPPSNLEVAGSVGFTENGVSSKDTCPEVCTAEEHTCWVENYDASGASRVELPPQYCMDGCLSQAMEPTFSSFPV